MPRYFIKLSYNGGRYNGWQIQKNTAVTIQQVLNESVSKVLAEQIEFTGCGRTDTGVHASCFYAHFDSAKESLHTCQTDWVYKFNSILPNDIIVSDIFKVMPTANSRFDAVQRTYQYWITTERNPFLANTAFYVHENLDIDLMNEACKKLLLTKDFNCFCKSGANSATTFCNVTDAKWVKKEITNQPFASGHFLVFEITADRFLRNMVRAIVGTLLDVGKRKTSVEQFEKILKSKNRSNAGVSVPAHALYLSSVIYPENIFVNE
jgi:tRNA pseudouridine38-40 synthase